jgi:hypothetical protein
MTPEEFQRSFMPYAQGVSQRTGLDPRLVLAQAALETGYGRSAPNNNFFGIKSHGQSGGSNLMTQEFENGRMVSRPQSFRGYEGPEQSFQGYADFILNNPRYGDVMAQGDLAGQIGAMGQSGYATDPDYASKLSSIARRFGGDVPDAPMRARVGNSNSPTGGILSNEGDQMAQQQQPQGLLGSLGIQRRDPNAQGETSQPFYNRQSFGDTLARMAPALGRMGVMGLEGPAQAALDSRNERQGDERAQQAQAKQRNDTADWLRSLGSTELADGVANGSLTGAQAMSQHQANAAAVEPVRGINVDGNLVNPVTGELMFAAGSGQPPPNSPIGKLQQDLRNNQISQEEYDIGLANMAPSGMRIVSDGRGGFTMEQGSAVGAEDGRMSPSDPQAMIDSIDGILNDPALDRSTGLFSAMQNIPGTDQYRFGTRARQLEGQAFLQAFESLKGAGQITEVEGTKATQAVGRMDTALQADDYREALNDLRSILTTAQARGAAMQSPSGNATAPAGARIRYDAEGNRL